MIEPKDFMSELIKNELSPFIEVPCSYFKDLINYILNTKAIEIINPVNEALAMGIASGNYLGSSKIPIVAIQNSGLMNTLNALTSLNQIYEIPVFYLITWRGEGGRGSDAPEHDIVGENLLQILRAFNMPFEVIDYNNYPKQITKLTKLAQKTKQPVALVIKKHTFAPYPLKRTRKEQYKMDRLDAIKIIKRETKGKALFISSTGFPSRDSFAASDTSDFYTVGAMGHIFSLAIGVAPYINKKLVVLDGDASSLMHVGGLASFDPVKHKNIMYIVLDNEISESTGGQPTSSKNVNFTKLAEAFGFKRVYTVQDGASLKQVIKDTLKSSDSLFIHIKIRKTKRRGTRRVSNTYLCPEIKKRFMKEVRAAGNGK